MSLFEVLALMSRILLVFIRLRHIRVTKVLSHTILVQIISSNSNLAIWRYFEHSEQEFFNEGLFSGRESQVTSVKVSDDWVKMSVGDVREDEGDCLLDGAFSSITR